MVSEEDNPLIEFFKTFTDLELVTIQHAARTVNDTTTINAVLAELKRRVPLDKSGSRESNVGDGSCQG